MNEQKDQARDAMIARVRKRKIARAGQPPRMVPPSIPPRYDERFFEIARLLDEGKEATDDLD